MTLKLQLDLVDVLVSISHASSRFRIRQMAKTMPAEKNGMVSLFLKKQQQKKRAPQTVDGARDLAKTLQTFMTERENYILNSCK